ncbi:MAG: radical SAM protein [Promethearchaeota archaeon]
MSEEQKLLNVIKSGDASWIDYSKFLNMELQFLKKFLNHAQNITKRNLGNIVKIYNPTKKFPAISITGSECALNCEHCNKKYLKGMKQIVRTEDLEQFLFNLSKNNGTGALISGGSDSNGAVPLLNFLDAIKKVKKETKLIINAHTGLLKEETARKLTEANVDIVSFDINMDEEVIRNVYHLDIDIVEYKRAIELLKKYNLSVVPHICVGLHYGELHKEIESIKFIKETMQDPPLIVVIALIPPKNSVVKFKTPKPDIIAKVIALIRFVFPNTEISLGCMRPRGKIKVQIEKLALSAGITRIEIPSKDTIKWLRNKNPKIEFRFFSACCAIPEKYENFAESKESEIKRYSNI